MLLQECCHHIGTQLSVTYKTLCNFSHGLYNFNPYSFHSNFHLQPSKVNQLISTGLILISTRDQIQLWISWLISERQVLPSLPGFPKLWLQTSASAWGTLTKWHKRSICEWEKKYQSWLYMYLQLNRLNLNGFYLSSSLSFGEVFFGIFFT